MCVENRSYPCWAFGRLHLNSSDQVVPDMHGLDQSWDLILSRSNVSQDRIVVCRPAIQTKGGLVLRRSNILFTNIEQRELEAIRGSAARQGE